MYMDHLLNPKAPSRKTAVLSPVPGFNFHYGLLALLPQLLKVKPHFQELASLVWSVPLPEYLILGGKKSMVFHTRTLTTGTAKVQFCSWSFWKKAWQTMAVASWKVQSAMREELMPFNRCLSSLWVTSQICRGADSMLLVKRWKTVSSLLLIEMSFCQV